jgi:acetyltransferase-like isoleucine patch superfamily enzyme
MRSSLFAAAGQLAVRSFRFTPLMAGWHVEIGGPVEVRGRVWLPGRGRVRLGSGVVLIGRRAPVELRAHEGGEIVIEDGVVIEDGASIEATRSVRIGARARLGAFCKVIDNNFHQTMGDRFERPEPVPVSIGEGAIVGPRAVVLPGAELGAGAILGPAEVLSFRLPAGAELPGPEGATNPSHEQH